MTAPADVGGVAGRRCHHPPTAAGQHAGLPRVRGQLRPGDLLVYRTDGRHGGTWRW